MWRSRGQSASSFEKDSAFHSSFIRRECELCVKRTLPNVQTSTVKAGRRALPAGMPCESVCIMLPKSASEKETNRLTRKRQDWLETIARLAQTVVDQYDETQLTEHEAV